MDVKEFKKIDAHAHIGEFGGWAKLSINAEQLIAQMDEFNIEKTLLCSEPNEICLDAVEKYHQNCRQNNACNCLRSQPRYTADGIRPIEQENLKHGIQGNLYDTAHDRADQPVSFSERSDSGYQKGRVGRGHRCSTVRPSGRLHALGHPNIYH